MQSHRGKTIGLLPELQKEFYKLTGQKIYIYTAYRFIELAGKFLNTQVADEAIEDVKSLQTETRIPDSEVLITEIEEELEKELTEEAINAYLLSAVQTLKNETGWAELAPLGVYLIRNTPINYRNLGYPSLRRFIESRELFEVKVLQKSPNAKYADSAYVKPK